MGYSIYVYLRDFVTSEHLPAEKKDICGTWNNECRVAFADLSVVTMSLDVAYRYFLLGGGVSRCHVRRAVGG